MERWDRMGPSKRSGRGEVGGGGGGIGSVGRWDGACVWGYSYATVVPGVRGKVGG